MSVTVEQNSSKIPDLKVAGAFIANVCSKEPKGRALSSEESTTSAASVPSETKQRVSSGDLAVENAKIPSGNRPVSAVTVTKIELRGFNPVIPVPVGRMVMKFSNGYSTKCTKWDLLNQKPTPQSLGSKKCQVAKAIPESWGSDRTPLQPFKKGETVELNFGSDKWPEL